MKETNIHLAQQDIDEALSTIESLEKELSETAVPKEVVKEKFIFLSKKLQEIEGILKTEGILD
jgi:hypothetical protein